MTRCLLDNITNAVSLVATAWIPKKPWMAVVGGFAWWYGHQVALTYAPGIVAQYFINITAANVTVGGVLLGTTIVAPMMTPILVPGIAIGLGCAFFYVAVLIANLVQKYIFDKCCRGKEESEPSATMISVANKSVDRHEKIKSNKLFKGKL